MKFNHYFDLLSENYAFGGSTEKQSTHSDGLFCETIDLGIGDVPLPLCGDVTREMAQAAEEMSLASGFKGYSPPSGYSFLKKAIADDYANNNVDLNENEIFITDGTKNELLSLFLLFDRGISVLFPTPCYPAAVEAATICGNEICFAPSDENLENYPPFAKKCDVVYLCSPQNPSGKTLSREKLGLWIEYALTQNAVIFFDGAYSRFISDGSPKSIYEIPEAKKCAVEIRSFSKSFGFTGLRLGYTIIPDNQRALQSIKKRFIGCANNGVSYVTQRGGAACFTKKSLQEAEKRIRYYTENAAAIKCTLEKHDIKTVVGNSSPYVYARCPDGFSDDEFCNFLLSQKGIIATAGNKFYQQNGNYFRLSAFKDRQTIFKACDRLNRGF